MKFIKIIFVFFVVTYCSICGAFNPQKTTIVVPFPPGGTVDLIARLVAQAAKNQGINVVIENRGGAEGRIPYAMFAKLRNQSNTLLMGASGPMYFAPLLAESEVGYDTLTSFQPIIHIGKAYHFILAHPSSQVIDLRNLIKIAQTNKIPLNFASGNATSRFMLEYLFTQAKIRGHIIPYNAGGPAFIAMMSGYVPFGAESTPSASIHINSGKLRALAITSLKRIPQAPSIATINETLKTNFEVFSTYALLGTQDISTEALYYYNTLFNKAIQDKFIRDKFYEFQTEITGGSIEYLTDDIRFQTQLWKNINSTIWK